MLIVAHHIWLILHSCILQICLVVLVTTTPEPTPRPRIEYQIATWSLVGASVITLIIIVSLGITLWLRTRSLWQPSGLPAQQSLLHGDLWCRQPAYTDVIWSRVTTNALVARLVPVEAITLQQESELDQKLLTVATFSIICDLLSAAQLIIDEFYKPVCTASDVYVWIMILQLSSCSGATITGHAMSNDLAERLALVAQTFL